MRQLLNIVVTLVLLVSTSGVIINKHYSGGELFSAAFFVDAKSCCETSCCHHEHQNNCHDESDFYKLLADYLSPDKPVLAKDLVIERQTLEFAGIQLIHNSTLAETATWFQPNEHAPPPVSDIPVLYHSLLL